MQDSYNSSSYTQIQTEESLIIPECVNWNMMNSVGSMPTNYRERLMTENADSNSSYIDDSNVPRPQIYTQKRRQITLKLDINNIATNYDSDDSDDGSTVVNVPKTIKIMDILYNTNFSSQLRSEQNISTISHYLKNIINKTDGRRKNEVYSIKKIVNVLNWMMQDWQIESIVKVIVNITANWTLDESKKDDSRLARLIRRITVEWDPQYIAHLVSILFTTHPLCKENTDSCKEYKEVFLKVLSKRWKFCRLSQFFICLGNKGAINHKLKMHLLQRAAKLEDTKKKMNFNFNTQPNRPQYIISSPQVTVQTQIQPQYQFQVPSQSQPQPQPQFQTQIQLQNRQTQSVDACMRQMNQTQTQNGQSPQIYQTVMILSSQATVVRNQGSPSSTPGQSPRNTFFQIQDFQRPFYSQSPLNDNASMASSSNSPITASPPSLANSIPVISTPSSTNIPMVTIRSMNHAMTTMNTQQVPVVMTSPLSTPSTINSTPQRVYQELPLNYNMTTTGNNTNSPSMLVSNVITVPSTPQSVASETVIRLPQGTPVFQTLSQQGTPIHTPSTITVSTPSTENSVLFSPSTSSTTSRITSPEISSPSTIHSISSCHSKLKGKEEEDSTSSSSTVIHPPNNQTLLFMTPSSNYSNSEMTQSTTSSPQINVSVPIPLSLNVRNIKQRIDDLTLKAEKNNEILENKEINKSSPSMSEMSIEKTSSASLLSKSNTMITTTSTKIPNDKININSSVSTASPKPQHSLLSKEIQQQEEGSSSSFSQKTIMESNDQPVNETQEEEVTITVNEASSPELEDSKIPDDHSSYYEEIFNLDDFNHEEKKAIYDIIDSSKEDLDQIQMEKDEKIRGYIQENKKDFSNLSSSPKTPPPSLASSPFFQK